MWMFLLPSFIMEGNSYLEGNETALIATWHIARKSMHRQYTVCTVICLFEMSARQVRLLSVHQIACITQVMFAQTWH